MRLTSIRQGITMAADLHNFRFSLGFRGQLGWGNKKRKKLVKFCPGFSVPYLGRWTGGVE
jgi:hypothetical protein